MHAHFNTEISASATLVIKNYKTFMYCPIIVHIYRLPVATMRIKQKAHH